MTFRTKDFLLLDHMILKEIIPVFPCSSMASEMAVKWGGTSKNVIKLERRFEFVWVVGKRSTDTISKHIKFDVLHIYTGDKVVTEEGLKPKTVEFRGDQIFTRKTKKKETAI